MAKKKVVMKKVVNSMEPEIESAGGGIGIGPLLALPALGLLAACGGGSGSEPITITPPVASSTVTVPPVIQPPVVSNVYFSDPKKIEGIKIDIPTTQTANGWVFAYSVGGFYYANGTLSVVPTFYPGHGLNADPTQVGKHFDVYNKEWAYSLQGTTATPLPSTAQVSFLSNAIEVADFNGDGINDVFIGDGGYDAYPFPGGQNTLLFGNPNGTFTKGVLPTKLDFTHSSAVADVNGDGFVDIYVGNAKLTGETPYFLINDGKGNFTENTNLLHGLPGYFDRAPYVTYTASMLGDINSDGKMDLVLGGLNTGSEFLTWDGSKFVVTQHLYMKDDATRSITSVTYADLDKDGKNEIIMHSTNQTTGAFYNEDRIDIWKLDANGNYSHAQQMYTSKTTWNQNLYVTDVNDDGYLDFVALGHDSKLFLNDRGTFIESNYDLPGDKNTAAVEMWDINNDGRLDILYTQFEPSTSSANIHSLGVYVVFG